MNEPNNWERKIVCNQCEQVYYGEEPWTCKCGADDFGIIEREKDEKGHWR